MHSIITMKGLSNSKTFQCLNRKFKKLNVGVANFMCLWPSHTHYVAQHSSIYLHINDDVMVIRQGGKLGCLVGGKQGGEARLFGGGGGGGGGAGGDGGGGNQ